RRRVRRHRRQRRRDTRHRRARLPHGPADRVDWDVARARTPCRRAPKRTREVSMSGTVAQPVGITNPPIDKLLEAADSKYALVIYGAKRARQINAYNSQLQEGLLE